MLDSATAFCFYHQLPQRTPANLFTEISKQAHNRAREAEKTESDAKLRPILHTRHPKMTYRCLRQRSHRISIYYCYSFCTTVPKGCSHTEATHAMTLLFNQLGCCRQSDCHRSAEVSVEASQPPVLPDHSSETSPGLEGEGNRLLQP